MIQKITRNRMKFHEISPVGGMVEHALTSHHCHSTPTRLGRKEAKEGRKSEKSGYLLRSWEIMQQLGEFTEYHETIGAGGRDGNLPTLIVSTIEQIQPTVPRRDTNIDLEFLVPIPSDEDADDKMIPNIPTNMLQQKILPQYPQ